MPDGTGLTPDNRLRLRSASELTVRFRDEPQSARSESHSGSERKSKADTFRDSIGLSLAPSAENTASIVDLNQTTTSPTLAKALQALHNDDALGAATRATLRGRIPVAPSPMPSPSPSPENPPPISELEKGDTSSSYAMPLGSTTQKRASSFRSTKGSLTPMDLSGTGRTPTLAGQRVRVPDDISVIERSITQHPSLDWTPKYRRGAGQIAIIIDEDRADETVHLHFHDLPGSAKAWFPLSILKILGRPGDSVATTAPSKGSHEEPERVFEIGDIVKMADGSSPDEFEVVDVNGRGGKSIGVRDARGAIRWFAPSELVFVSKGRPKDREDKLRDIFRYYDANGDGYMNREECNACLKQMDNLPLSEEEYLGICRRVGANPRRGLLLADVREMVTNVDKLYNAMMMSIRNPVLDSNFAVVVETPSPSSSMSSTSTYSHPRPTSRSDLRYWMSPLRWGAEAHRQDSLRGRTTLRV